MTEYRFAPAQHRVIDAQDRISAMSVKFKEETITKEVGGGFGAAATKGGKHDLAHEVGEALTKGGGANGYLAVRSIARDRIRQAHH